MTRLCAVATLCLLASLPCAARADVLIFDMGAPDSPVWPGAQRVTVSDPAWLSTDSLTALDSAGRGDPIWTNAFTEDAIIGSAPNTFDIAAAPGPWSVQVFCGFGGPLRERTNQVWDFDISVGQEQSRCQVPAPAWSGPYFRQTRLFHVTSDGRLRVHLTPRSKWCLLGIVAWPDANAAEAATVIEQIQQWAPPEEIAAWREDPRPPAGPPLAPSPRDRDRGFVVWHRHWATPIFPWTNPTAAEIDPTLRAFAAPGEYEPLTFTVRPLRGITRAAIEVGDIGPVPANAIDIRKVRYLKARPNYDVAGRYRIVPDILDRWEGGPLEAGENATFWLTIHVPDKAPAGLYRSHITFIADGQRAEIPVLLRVLDVTLEEDPALTYGIYYYDPLPRALDAPDEVSRAYWQRKAELERADMVAHGTRNVTLDCWAEAKNQQGAFPYLDQSLDRLQAQLALNARFGFRGPYVLSISTEEIYRKYLGVGLQSHLKDVKMPPDAFFAEVSDLVRTIENARRSRGWPDFVYQPFDEPGADPESVRFFARLLQAVKAAGVRTYTTAAPERPAYLPLKPFVDVWCTQTFLPDHDTVVADGRARGVQYWCYPNKSLGECDHTTVAGARMTYGFGFWRSGFVHLIPWIYQYDAGDPFNYLDAGTMDFLVRSEPDGTPLPVAIWEAFREGYDDMRYIYTLRRAISQAAASSSPLARAQAREAQALLDQIWAAVPVLPMYQYEGFWSGDEMDVYRWLIAQRLERLTQALAAQSPRSGS